MIHYSYHCINWQQIPSGSGFQQIHVSVHPCHTVDITQVKCFYGGDKPTRLLILDNGSFVVYYLTVNCF